ncbi:MAG: hypothetical protein AAGC53_12635 [Actinomycetota bacterium]
MPLHTDQPAMPEASAALSGPERVIVAPAAGIFEPTVRANGATIRRGQVIGHVRCGAERVEITSPFDGQARGTFAWPDERVRRYQPVLWMAGRAA